LKELMMLSNEVNASSRRRAPFNTVPLGKYSSRLLSENVAAMVPSPDSATLQSSDTPIVLIFCESNTPLVCAMRVAQIEREAFFIKLLKIRLLDRSCLHWSHIKFGSGVSHRNPSGHCSIGWHWIVHDWGTLSWQKVPVKSAPQSQPLPLHGLPFWHLT
jgi:hypothetical protein